MGFAIINHMNNLFAKTFKIFDKKVDMLTNMWYNYTCKNETLHFYGVLLVICNKSF